MKKVILYSHSPVVGGVLRHMESLAMELERFGLDVLIVVNPDKKIDDYVSRVTTAGMRVARTVASGWRDIRHLAAWRRLLVHERPDVVHFHQCAPHENAPAILVAVICRIPVVLTEHLPFWMMSTSLLRRLLRRIVLKFVRAVVLLGPSLITSYEQVTGIPRKKVKTIPPFSFSVLQQIRSWENVIGVIGELSERKGIHHLISMAPQLIAAGYRLRVFGRGLLGGHLQALASDSGGAMEILSFVGDPGQALGKIDVLLLLSKHEGLPLVILEAISAGVPVVTTKVGVIADYFADGEGLLYLNNTEGIEVLLKLEQLRLLERRKEIVMRGQTRFQTSLTPLALAKQMLDLYRRQVGREHD